MLFIELDSHNLDDEYHVAKEESVLSKARRYTTSSEIKTKPFDGKVMEKSRNFSMLEPNHRGPIQGMYTVKTTYDGKIDDNFRGRFPPSMYSYVQVKSVLDTAANNLANYQGTFADRLRTAKQIETMFRTLISCEEQHQTEGLALCNSNFLNLDNSELGQCWKTFKQNFFLINRAKVALIEVAFITFSKKS